MRAAASSAEMPVCRCPATPAPVRPAGARCVQLRRDSDAPDHARSPLALSLAPGTWRRARDSHLQSTPGSRARRGETPPRARDWSRWTAETASLPRVTGKASSHWIVMARTPGRARHPDLGAELAPLRSERRRTSGPTTSRTSSLFSCVNDDGGEIHTTAVIRPSPGDLGLHGSRSSPFLNGAVSLRPFRSTFLRLVSTGRRSFRLWRRLPSPRSAGRLTDRRRDGPRMADR